MRRAILPLLCLFLAGPVAAQTAVGPIHVEAPGYGVTLVYRDLRIACTAPGQTAIDLSWPDAPSVAVTTVVLENILIVPGCTSGVRLRNGWNARIAHVTYWGDPKNPGAVALELLGRSNDVSVQRFGAYYANVGVRVSEMSEGTTVFDARLIGVGTGVLVDTETWAPGLWVTGGHMSALSRGIVVRNHPQNIITGNIIYRNGQAADWIGIEVGAGASDTSLATNTVLCSAVAAGPHAVRINGGLSRVSQIQTNAIFCR